jgi:hypothetical protein
MQSIPFTVHLLFAFTCLGSSCAVAVSMYVVCVPPIEIRVYLSHLWSVMKSSSLERHTGNICILTPFKCHPSTWTVQIIIIPPIPMSSAKITDVKRDVFDSAQSGLNYLTSDQGVKVSDTDNW